MAGGLVFWSCFLDAITSQSLGPIVLQFWKVSRVSWNVQNGDCHHHHFVPLQIVSRLLLLRLLNPRARLHPRPPTFLLNQFITTFETSLHKTCFLRWPLQSTKWLSEMQPPAWSHFAVKHVHMHSASALELLTLWCVFGLHPTT